VQTELYRRAVIINEADRLKSRKDRLLTLMELPDGLRTPLILCTTDEEMAKDPQLSRRCQPFVIRSGAVPWRDKLASRLPAISALEGAEVSLTEAVELTATAESPSLAMSALEAIIFTRGG
jgi:hypothetical protein